MNTDQILAVLEQHGGPLMVVLGAVVVVGVTWLVKKYEDSEKHVRDLQSYILGQEKENLRVMERLVHNLEIMQREGEQQRECLDELQKAHIDLHKIIMSAKLDIQRQLMERQK